MLNIQYDVYEILQCLKPVYSYYIKKIFLVKIQS